MYRLIVIFICGFFCMKDLSVHAATTVVMKTSQGDVEITLFDDVAPKACENFLTHAKNGYYDGLIFHRVIKGFMIQGGDPTGTGTGGTSIWGASFEDECSASRTFDRPGLLAMANAGPNTNGSQFFITCAKTPWLNQHHTIFGEVSSGLNVIKAIEATKTDSRDRPVEQQKIVSLLIKNEM